MKKIIIEKNNNDNITWYEDDKIQIIAPCYYDYKQVYQIIKKYTDNKLIVNNMLDNAIMP